MVMTNEVSQKRLQIGKETVPGTPVAATFRTPAQFQFNYAKPMANSPDRTGTRKQRLRPSYGRQVITGTITDKGSFEDLPRWFDFGINGAVTATPDAGTPTPAQTRLYLPADIGNLDTFTAEHGEPGNQYETNQCLLNTVTIRMDGDSDDEPYWVMEAAVLGRGWDPTTYTPALALADTELILARGTKVYVDDAGGSIGTTQLTGKMISAAVTLNNQAHYKAFMEDEVDFAANKIGYGAVLVDFQLTMEFDDDDEFAFYRNSVPQQRLIRFEREGSVIHTTVKKRARMDLFGFYSAWTEQEREGNMTMTLSGQAFYDVSEGTEAKFEIVNDLATLFP